MELYKIIDKSNKKPYFEVTIKADENDADYRTETRKYSMKEFNEKVSFLIYLLKVWEYYGEGDLADFPYYYEVGIPSSTNDSCHTIVEKSISFYNRDGEKSVVELDSIENDFYHKDDGESYDYSNIENLKTEEFMDVYKVLYAIYKVSGKDIKKWESCLQFALPTDSEWANMMVYFENQK